MTSKTNDTRTERQREQDELYAARLPRSLWRDSIPVHPAANLLPQLNQYELKALALDIYEHGQLEPIKLTPDGQLIDGRHRLDAMGMLGIKILTAKGTFTKAVNREWGE
jgi:hypothetical protein